MCRANVPGEILAKGPNVMLGYYKNEEATKQTIDENGWYHSGDLGTMDGDGNVFIKGRSKNMLLGASGQNIYPEEIEDKLNSLALVAESVVVQKGDKLVALKNISFSNDGRYFAYVISRSGSDWEEIYVMDVKTGKLLPDHIVWAKFTGADWLGDGFYYSAYDAPEKGKETSAKNEVQKVYYHKMGTPQSEDVLFYQNPANPLRFYSVSVNKEETMMFLTEAGMDQGSNLYVRDLRVPGSQFIQMTGDCSKNYAPAQIIGNRIYMVTNAGAPKYRMMVADINKPGYNDWKELVP